MGNVLTRLFRFFYAQEEERHMNHEVIAVDMRKMSSLERYDHKRVVKCALERAAFLERM